VITRRCFGLASNLKTDAGATAWTPRRRDLSKLELRQERRRLWTAVFKHPAYKAALVFCEFSIIIAHLRVRRMPARLAASFCERFGPERSQKLAAKLR
jgi:hypothetical protein